MGRKAFAILHRRALILIFLGVLFACAWVFTGLILKSPAGKKGDDGRVALILDYTWPEYKHSVTFGPSPQTAAFARALKKPGIGGEIIPGTAYRKISIMVDGRRFRSVWVTRAGEVIDAPHSGRKLGDGELARLAGDLAGKVDRGFFGEPLTWPEVAPLFPVGGTATVRDLETGMEFMVRRHRGDSHADVEPRTAADAAILKRIYNDEWSWRRRAVVVTVGAHKVAGSINGMPHGWGDIFDNQFVGHFCIHFLNSRVHTSWRQDPGHQLMVLKSSGRLACELETALPERVAYLVLAAVHQREGATLRCAVTGMTPAALRAMITPIRHIHLISVRRGSITGSEATVDVDLLVYYSFGDPQAGYRKNLKLHLERHSGIPGWKVRAASLKGLCIPAMALHLTRVVYDSTSPPKVERLLYVRADISVIKSEQTSPLQTR